MQLPNITSLIMATMMLYACSVKEKSGPLVESSDQMVWKQLDDFHLTMSEAYHPYKDSANLVPAKRLAKELADKAGVWASASLPDQINSDDIKAQLNKLEEDSRSFATLIQGGASDEEIAAALDALHGSFHLIMESWNHE